MPRHLGPEPCPEANKLIESQHIPQTEDDCYGHGLCIERQDAPRNFTLPVDRKPFLSYTSNCILVGTRPESILLTYPKGRVGKKRYPRILATPTSGV